MTEQLELNEKIENCMEIYFKICRSYYAEIDFNYAFISIEQIMPSALDRGKFKILANHKAEFVDKCYIDSSDAFPRYYFNFDCMIKELKSWIEARPYLFIKDIRIVNNQGDIGINISIKDKWNMKNEVQGKDAPD